MRLELYEDWGFTDWGFMRTGLYEDWDEGGDHARMTSLDVTPQPLCKSSVFTLITLTRWARETWLYKDWGCMRTGIRTGVV